MDGADAHRAAAASAGRQFHDTAPESGGGNTGASGGKIRKVVKLAFAMVKGGQEFGGNMPHFNVGVRYVDTIQTMTGRVSLPDPRNTTSTGAALPDGSRYSNIVKRAAHDDAADLFSQLPGVSFGALSADQANIGSPALSPYLSIKLDCGSEYYTDRESVNSFKAFCKSFEGFTSTAISTVPFANLAQYGITYDMPNATQQIAINARGRPTALQVQITSQVTASNKLMINCLEF